MPKCPPRWAGNRRPTFAEGADEQALRGQAVSPRGRCDQYVVAL